MAIERTCNVKIALVESIDVRELEVSYLNNWFIVDLFLW